MEDGAQLAPRLRVQPGKGIVEDQELRGGQQGPGQQHLPHLAVGKAADAAPQQIADLQQGRQVAPASVAAATREHEVSDGDGLALFQR
jgi:hypothetical protein